MEALGQLGFDEPGFYLEGLRYRQLEPAWGKPNDTAINLRGACAFALARSRMIGLNDKLIALTELLADSERLARVHAVNAIADLGHESVVPLLRVKATCGDTEADVIGACLSSLLKLAPRESVSFVARFLSSPNEPIVLEAAAALGESGLPEAINLLIATCQRTTDRDVLESFLVSLGLSRQPLAIEFLISRLNPVTSSSEPALKALAPSRFYPDIYRRVQGAVEASGNRRLQALFQEAFGDK